MSDFKDLMGAFGAMGEKMMEQMKEMESRGKEVVLSAKSGGGLVSVSANGNGEVVDVSIDESLMDDRESLQILLISAFNDVLGMVDNHRKNAALGALGGFGDLNSLEKLGEFFKK